MQIEAEMKLCTIAVSQNNNDVGGHLEKQLVQDDQKFDFNVKKKNLREEELRQANLIQRWPNRFPPDLQPKSCST